MNEWMNITPNTTYRPNTTVLHLYVMCGYIISNVFTINPIFRPSAHKTLTYPSHEIFSYLPLNFSAF